MLRTYDDLKKILLWLMAIPLITSCVADVNEPPDTDGAFIIFSTTNDPSGAITEFNFGATAIVPGRSIEELYIINIGEKEAQNFTSAFGGTEFQYSGGTFPGIGGDCLEDTLAVGASCKIVLRFNPPATTAYSAEFTLNFNDTQDSNSASLTLEGQGTDPALITISETDPYDYGLQPLNTPGEHVFSLSNIPTGAIAKDLQDVGLNPPYEFKNGDFPGEGGTCTDQLDPNGSCTIVVTFTPVNVGVQLDQIEIQYDNGVTTVSSTRDVQGEGVIPATLEITQAPLYDFGTLINSQTANFVFTITNTGGLPATSVAGTGLAFPFTFTGGAYPGTAGTCGATVAPAATCDIDITFAPINAGLFTDTIEMPYNNGAELVTATRDIQGTAVTPANLEISEAPLYDFGVAAIGSTATHVLTVTNTGGFQATSILDTGGLAAPFSYLGGAYPGTGGDCNISLAPAATCQVVIEFAPTVAANSSDTIAINYNDGLVPQ